MSRYVIVVLTKTKTYFVKAVLLVRVFFPHRHPLHNLIVDASKVENAAETKYQLNQLGIITILAASPEYQYMNPVERSQQTLASIVSVALVTNVSSIILSGDYVYCTVLM